MTLHPSDSCSLIPLSPSLFAMWPFPTLLAVFPYASVVWFGVYFLCIPSRPIPVCDTRGELLNRSSPIVAYVSYLYLILSLQEWRLEIFVRSYFLIVFDVVGKVIVDPCLFHDCGRFSLNKIE